MVDFRTNWAGSNSFFKASIILDNPLMEQEIDQKVLTPLKDLGFEITEYQAFN